MAARMAPLQRHTLHFWLLAALSVAMVWYVPFFPSSDGLSHTIMGQLLHRLHAGDGFTRAYYQLTAGFVPNMSAQYLLAGLDMLTQAPHLSEKCFVSGLIILYVFSLKRFIACVSGGNPLSCYAPFLFLFTGFFTGGGFNHLISLSLALLLCEYWLYHAKKWRLSFQLLLSAGLYITYLSHPFGLVLWCIIIGSHILSSAWVEWRQKRCFPTQFLSHGMAIVPGLCLPLLGLYYYLQLPKLPSGGYVVADYNAWELLIGGYAFSGYQLHLQWLATLTSQFILGTWGYLCYRTHKLPAPLLRQSLWLVMAIFLLLLIYSPAQYAGGWFIHQRLAQCFFIASIASIATMLPAHTQHIKRQSSAACVLVAMILGIHGWEMHTIQPLLREVQEMTPHIRPQHSLLTLNINMNQSAYEELHSPTITLFNPLWNYGAYATAEKNLIWLDSYQMRERNAFPVGISPLIDPLNHLTLTMQRTLGQSDTYAFMDFAHYNQHSAHPIDYISIWGKEAYIQDKKTVEGYQHIMSQLQQDYQLIYTSSHGLLRLWERKGLDTTP